MHRSSIAEEFGNTDLIHYSFHPELKNLFNIGFCSSPSVDSGFQTSILVLVFDYMVYGPLEL